MSDQEKNKNQGLGQDSTAGGSQFTQKFTESTSGGNQFAKKITPPKNNNNNNNGNQQ